MQTCVACLRLLGWSRDTVSGDGLVIGSRQRTDDGGVFFARWVTTGVATS